MTPPQPPPTLFETPTGRWTTTSPSRSRRCVPTQHLPRSPSKNLIRPVTTRPPHGLHPPSPTFAHLRPPSPTARLPQADVLAKVRKWAAWTRSELMPVVGLDMLLTSAGDLLNMINMIDEFVRTAFTQIGSLRNAFLTGEPHVTAAPGLAHRSPLPCSPLRSPALPCARLRSHALRAQSTVSRCALSLPWFLTSAPTPPPCMCRAYTRAARCCARPPDASAPCGSCARRRTWRTSSQFRVCVVRWTG